MTWCLLMVNSRQGAPVCCEGRRDSIRRAERVSPDAPAATGAPNHNRPGVLELPIQYNDMIII